MSYSAALIAALSPSACDLGRTAIAPTDYFATTTNARTEAVDDYPAGLSWIRREGGVSVARSRQGGLFTLQPDGETTDGLTLSYESETGEIERLSTGDEAALKLSAERFDAAPAVFRFVRDAAARLRPSAASRS